jgi:hypothetical protein
MKTNELIKAALNWAVAKCKGFIKNETWFDHRVGRHFIRVVKNHSFEDHVYWEPSTDWSQGGPIIEREGIALWPDDEEGGWFASANGGQGEDYKGPTPLIAAMRCYVASKLGDEVEIPKELQP